MILLNHQERGAKMTIKELIEELEKVPKELKNLPIYVFENESSVKIIGISLHDDEEKHSKDNPLSLDIE